MILAKEAYSSLPRNTTKSSLAPSNLKSQSQPRNSERTNCASTNSRNSAQHLRYAKVYHNRADFRPTPSNSVVIRQLPEVQMKIFGNRGRAILDTGAMITIANYSFFPSNFNFGQRMR